MERFIIATVKVPNNSDRRFMMKYLIWDNKKQRFNKPDINCFEDYRLVEICLEAIKKLDENQILLEKHS